MLAFWVSLKKVVSFHRAYLVSMKKSTTGALVSVMKEMMKRILEKQKDASVSRKLLTTQTLGFLHKKLDTFKCRRTQSMLAKHS